ncbi:MAG: NapC/NirT family cytochrome c [Nitrospirae bacterium]|nr:NapC/NirT family cytochrome c [Nitrospirota bacterium]
MDLAIAIAAGVNIILLTGALFRLVPMGSGARKLVLFGALGMFPVLWGTLAFGYNFNRIKHVEFCGTCHAMDGHVRSLGVDDTEPLSAVHYQNNYVPQETACYFCHTGYTWFGPVMGKVNGIRHIYVNYFKGVPERIHIYTPYPNRDCLRCHGKARRFLEKPVHNRQDGQMMRHLQDGTMSCLTDGCHDLAHLLPEDWS